MATPIITVENLGKRYTLRHQARGYQTLRGAIDAGIRRLLTAGRSAASAPGSPGDTSEAFWALKDVSFEIQRGDVVGIIGRNGAGKSTLLKILSRITEPTKGRIRLHGRVASLLEVGTGFHPELTGRENIYLNGAILGMSKQEIRTKFDEIVTFAEVERFLDTAVKHYSSGMYVRLAFAVAAHLEPEILVVDEVLAVGDTQFQKKCLGKLKAVSSEQGRTVLFVSHQLNTIESLCTRCLMLQSGMVTADARDTRSVINRYLDPENTDTHCSWVRNSPRHDNPYFAPLQLELTTSTSLQPPFPRNAPLHVRVVGDVTLVDHSVAIGYELYNENNELLYCSYHTDGPETSWPVLKPGQNILTSDLPPWLNEGRYRLALSGGLYCRNWLFPPGAEVPSITFEIRGGLSDSPYWQSRRSGTVGPIISWKRG